MCDCSIAWRLRRSVYALSLEALLEEVRSDCRGGSCPVAFQLASVSRLYTLLTYRPFQPLWTVALISRKSCRSGSGSGSVGSRSKAMSRTFEGAVSLLVVLD